MAFVTRKYGLPFRRYNAASPRHLAALEDLTEDSRDCYIESNGIAVGRWGSRIIGETQVTAPSGLLETSSTYKSRQMQSLNSPSMDNGDPVPACLYTREGGAAIQFGTLYYRSSDSTGYNYQLGKEYSATQFPTYYKVPPVIYQSGAFGLTRGSSAALRRFFCGGSRSFVQANGQAMSPGLHAMPIKHNKRWNDSTSSGTEINRIYPWGMLPPLFPPTFGSMTASASQNDRNFLDGDAFVVSVIFEDENGQWSMPFTPRPATKTNSGHITVGTVRTGTGTALVAHSSGTLSNVAIGPPGTRRRIIVRTNKVNLSSSTQTTADAMLRGRDQRADEIDVHPEHFYVWAIIEDNSATSIVIDSGNDESLVPDPRVRFDTVWPRPSRYAFELEGRVAVGYTRYHPGAFILAPTGQAASRDLNAPDTGIPTATAFAYRIDAANLVLQYYATVPHAAPAETAIPLSGSTTVQDLVDLINATTVAGSAKEWAAQLVPGSDPTALVTSQLSATRMSGTYSISGVTLTYSAGFGPADIAVGMECKEVDGGTRGVIATVNVAAGTLTTVDALGDDASTLVWFGTDTGDAGLDTSADVETLGIVRVFNPAYPAIAAFRNSYLSALIGYEDKQELMFTARSPEQASAAETFMIGNFRKPQASDNAGILMGGAPLPIGGVVGFSKAIYTFENRKEGGTGEDQDYQLYPLNLGRGCIAPGSWVFGNGWVGYLTRDGYVITDGRKEIIITGDIYDPGEKYGVLDEEINTSFTSAEDDSDSSTFYASLAGSRLYIAFSRTSLGDDNAGHMFYDFSPSVEYSGIRQMLDAEGAPFAWSPPARLKLGPMCEVVHTDQFSSNGPHLYAETQTSPGSTDGEIIQFDIENVLYDENNETAVSCTWATPSTTLTAATGDFSAVAVGAKGFHASVNAAQFTVTAKASDQLSVTISVTTSGTGTAQSITFKGQEIPAQFDCATDLLLDAGGTRHDAAFHNAHIHYKSQAAGVLTCSFSRDKARSSAGTAYTIPAITESFDKYKLPLRQAHRSPTDVGEFRFSHDGRGTVRPELWGVEAEVEILTQEE